MCSCLFVLGLLLVVVFGVCDISCLLIRFGYCLGVPRWLCIVCFVLLVVYDYVCSMYGSSFIVCCVWFVVFVSFVFFSNIVSCSWFVFVVYCVLFGLLCLLLIARCWLLVVRCLCLLYVV